MKIETGKPLHKTGMTLKSLKESGYKAVFIGIGTSITGWTIGENLPFVYDVISGMPEAKRIPVFEGLTEEMGFFTSKDFLPQVTKASKPGTFAL